MIVDDTKKSGRPTDVTVDDKLEVIDDELDGSHPDNKI
jgi:hypothetical protein